MIIRHAALRPSKDCEVEHPFHDFNPPTGEIYCKCTICGAFVNVSVIWAAGASVSSGNKKTLDWNDEFWANPWTGERPPLIKIPNPNNFIIESPEDYREFRRFLEQKFGHVYVRADGQKDITSVWLNLPVLGALKLKETRELGKNKVEVTHYRIEISNISFEYGFVNQTRPEEGFYRRVYVSCEHERIKSHTEILEVA